MKFEDGTWFYLMRIVGAIFGGKKIILAYSISLDIQISKGTSRI